MEKAGIIKPGSTVVCAPQFPEAMEVIAKTCRDRDASLVNIDTEVTWQRRDFNPDGQSFQLRSSKREYSLNLPLLGEYQLENAATAVAAVEVVISEKKTEAGEESMKKWGKIVVLGDSDLVSNTHLKLAGNKDFFLNTLNWLAEENILISVRRKEPGLTPLMMTVPQGRLVFWLSMVIVPSLVLVVGIGVTAKRRRSA